MKPDPDTDSDIDAHCAAFNDSLAAAVEDCVRDPDERRQAIERHGTACHGCGLTLADVYGAIAEGFIDVHRVTPSHYSDDLVPLCPSCHTVVHAHEPQLSIDRLRLLVRDAVRARRTARSPAPTDRQSG